LISYSQGNVNETKVVKMSVTFSRQKEVFTSAVLGPIDMASVLVGLFALRVIKIPIILLVACFMVFGYAIAL
jgi:hypothetical protein